MLKVSSSGSATGPGGKSYFTFTGDVSAVQAGSSAGVAIAKEKGLLVDSEVIPSPSHRLIRITFYNN